MAVYVVLAFDNEEEAKKFVGGTIQSKVVVDYVTEEAMKVEVYGVYKKPTQFCTCISGGKRDGGYRRGTNYGWWVHAACNKPTPGVGKQADWFASLGTNLLPDQLHPGGAQFRTRGWPKSPKEWSFLLNGKELTTQA